MKDVDINRFLDIRISQHRAFQEGGERNKSGGCAHTVQQVHYHLKNPFLMQKSNKTSGSTVLSCDVIGGHQSEYEGLHVNENISGISIFICCVSCLVGILSFLEKSKNRTILCT